MKSHLSHGTVYRIITEDLQLKCVHARWVPHYLNPSQKQDRISTAQNILKFFQQNHRSIQDRLVVTDEKWFYHRSVETKSSNTAWLPVDAPPPRVVKRTTFEKKTMVIVAFSFDGKFHIDAVPANETVTGAYYCQFLKRIIHNYGRHVHPLRAEQMVLMHDNARPHVKSVSSSISRKKRHTSFPTSLEPRLQHAGQIGLHIPGAQQKWTPFWRAENIFER
jgi:hypothetical protein